MADDFNQPTPSQESGPAQDNAQAESHAPVPPDQLKNQIVETLHTVYDPEIPVDIYELGLIYKLEVDASGKVDIEMTLTSPMCPVAGSLPPEVENKVRQVPGVRDVKLDLVWDPPWSMEKMSEAARLQLGMF